VALLRLKTFFLLFRFGILLNEDAVESAKRWVAIHSARNFKYVVKLPDDDELSRVSESLKAINNSLESPDADSDSLGDVVVIRCLKIVLLLCIFQGLILLLEPLAANK